VAALRQRVRRHAGKITRKWVGRDQETTGARQRFV
jgi:hypothetical protein